MDQDQIDSLLPRQMKTMVIHGETSLFEKELPQVNIKVDDEDDDGGYLDISAKLNVNSQEFDSTPYLKKSLNRTKKYLQG